MKTAKNLNFQEEARNKIKVGVNALGSAVQATLGPKGRNVLIEKENGNPLITKDGVTVAKEIHLKDPIENIGAQAIKEVSMKAAKLAGDGTTTATVLACNLYNEGLKSLAAGANPIELKRGMDKTVTEIIKNLTQQLSVDVTTNEAIRQVATISANNDATIGNLIAEAMDSVGKNGIIQAQESKSSETTLEIVDGLQIDRGFISPYFANNQSTMTTTLENPLILLCDKRISSVKEILPLLETCSKQNKPLLVIADDVDGEALATMVLNKARGILNICAVKAPGYGEQKLHNLEDIAILTKGTVISAQKGLKLDKLQIDHLGTCKTVTVSQTETVIVDGGGDSENIKTRITDLQTQYENAESDYQKEQLKARISKLIGGVALLNIGAATELELKEKKDRVDDALQATRAAVEEGIVPGGGISLLLASQNIVVETENQDQDLGVNLVKQACKAPFRVICENAGKSSESILAKIESIEKENPSADFFGYDARNDKYVPMIDSGIIDPTKVTRTALELAVSAAGTLLTTECVITIDPEEKAKEQKMNMYE
jgi:chaperonin GroEL